MTTLTFRYARNFLLVALFLTATRAISGSESDGKKSLGQIRFTTGHEDYQAEGEFKEWRFTRVDIPGGDLEKGTVEIEINLASVSEKSPKLAQHLREPDFFSVEKFPKATLVISDVKKRKDGSFQAVALLDFHGLHKQMPLEFEVTSDKPLKITGWALLSRGAFNVGAPYQKGKRRSILEEVRITFSITLPEALESE